MSHNPLKLRGRSLYWHMKVYTGLLSVLKYPQVPTPGKDRERGMKKNTADEPETHRKKKIKQYIYCQQLTLRNEIPQKNIFM